MKFFRNTKKKIAAILIAVLALSFVTAPKVSFGATDPNEGQIEETPVVVETEVPVSSFLTVAGVEDGKLYNKPVTPIVTTTCVGVDPVLTLALNGDEFVSGSTISESGQYVLSAADECGNAQIVNFVIDTTMPNLLTPADLTFLNSASGVDFSWSRVVVDDADVTYDLELATDPTLGADGNSFATPVLSETGIANPADALAPTVNVTGLTDDTVYFWHVRSVIDGDPEHLSPWTDAWSFTVDNTPLMVEPIANITTSVATNVEAVVSEPTEVSTYLWEQIDGSGTLTFTSASEHATQILADANGVYVVRLTVKDQAQNATVIEFNFTWKGTVAPVVLTPPVRVAAVTYAAGNEVEATEDQGEVKSGAVIENNQNSSDDSGREFPTFGLVVLLVLLGFGLYLLYQQKPEWFNWLWGGKAKK